MKKALAKARVFCVLEVLSELAGAKPEDAKNRPRRRRGRGIVSFSHPARRVREKRSKGSRLNSRRLAELIPVS